MGILRKTKLLEPLIEIQNRLKKHPLAKFVADENSISLYPASECGFMVEFHVSVGNKFTVYFEGWHECFDDATEALNYFAFGLSKKCRLKTISRGGKPHRWMVQSCEGVNWVDDSETGLFLFPFWKKPEMKYLQNNISDQ